MHFATQRSGVRTGSFETLGAPEEVGEVESKRSLKRRNLLKFGLAGGVGAVGVAAFAGCGETQVVEVVKEVPVETVKEVVQEVAVVEERVVTKIIEVEKPQQETQRMVYLHFFNWPALDEPVREDGREVRG